MNISFEHSKPTRNDEMTIILAKIATGVLAIGVMLLVNAHAKHRAGFN
jgi:hypothetical protein